MKYRQIKKIKFWSLRDDIGPSGGVECDIDTLIIRKCQVVRTSYGLKWQLVKDSQYNDWYMHVNDTDQECLDNTNINDVEIIKEPMEKYSINGQRGLSHNKTNLCDIAF